ncbi:exonuclease SbcCD subunit D [Actinomyces culturomici]|uniref:exonuclease SbcCD subunit D n=1 Tax=Actinomyces culturomici TaxID=1926276 RepID=UPI000E20723B|nr:exonuclease SbcCD subunit D [Actinomyces culturomici]
MRILHTSDWHVGRTLHGADLADAVDAFFAWLLDVVEERGVDLVLVSGDLFDRAVPPIEALGRTSRVLEDLTSRARVITTSGNHDGPARLGLFAPMLDQRLVVATDPLLIGRAVECGDAEDGCLVYPLPYLEPDLVKQDLSDLPEEDGARPPLPRSHEAVIAAALRRVRADLEERRSGGDLRPAIVMVHAFLAGGAPSDSERDLEIGGVASAPVSLFDTLGGADAADLGLVYVAAGHLHRPQAVSGAKVPIRYSGSPIAYSFSEAGADKSVVLLDVDSDGARIEVLPIPPFRRVAVLRGTIAELLDAPDPALADAYCQVTVTDDARPERMVARIRAVYPRALVIQHDSAARAAIPAGASSPSAREPREVARDFFETVGARPLDDAEAAVVDGVWADIRKEAAK